MRARAVLFSAAVEAENGTRTVGAQVVMDQTASNKQAVQFVSDCVSGECMPVGDLPGWQQIFTDDFKTDVALGSFPGAVAQKWLAYPFDACFWQDTSKQGHYWPEKTLSVAQGLLNIYVHTENGPLCGGGNGPIHAVSAPYPVLPGASASNGQLYGRYAVRFRSDPIAGYKVAWLLWPDSEQWPRDGEVDFPEGNLDGKITAFMHRMNGTSGSDQDGYATSASFTAWHTAVIEWRPNDLQFILDGQVIGHSTSRVPSTPMHWVLQTETNLDGTPVSDSAAGNVQVDWVAVWKML